MGRAHTTEATRPLRVAASPATHEPVEDDVDAARDPAASHDAIVVPIFDRRSPDAFTVDWAPPAA